MKNTGFTLIELLIYLAVMSLAIVSLISWSLSISASEQRAVVESELQAAGRFAAEVVTRQVRQAVEIVNPPLPGEPDSIVKLDLATEPFTIISLVDGQLILENGQGSWPLTTEAVEVRNFVATNRSSTARQPHLDFVLTLAYRDGDSFEYRVEKTFNFSASSRR